MREETSCRSHHISYLCMHSTSEFRQTDMVVLYGISSSFHLPCFILQDVLALAEARHLDVAQGAEQPQPHPALGQLGRPRQV